MPLVMLFQPDIAGNVGNIARTCACLNVPLAIVEPCGFAFSERALRRAAMDYGDAVDLVRHANWDRARESVPADARMVLFTRHDAPSCYKFAFRSDDVLLFGSESAGVPSEVRDACQAAVAIPMHAGMRSLNLAVAVGMGLAEALRQTGQLPPS